MSAVARQEFGSPLTKMLVVKHLGADKPSDLIDLKPKETASDVLTSLGLNPKKHELKHETTSKVFGEDEELFPHMSNPDFVHLRSPMVAGK